MQQVLAEADGVEFRVVLPGQQGQGRDLFPQRIVPAVLKDDLIQLPPVRHRADIGHVPGEGPQHHSLIYLVFPQEHQVRPGLPDAPGQGFQSLRLQAVVCVQKDCPVLRAAVVQYKVNRRSAGSIGARIFLVNGVNPAVPGGKFVAQLAGTVRRAVVHQDDLEILTGLAQHGADAL